MSGRHALMWSGGKDSALALARAKASGIDVTRLLNFYDSETGRVRFHATRVAMLEAQADQLGIELRAVPTTWSAMAELLARELQALRADGFEGVVLGDIHLADVRAWYEDRVIAAGLKHVEPIWGEPAADLLDEFVDSGGRAVVTCVDLTRLEPNWLGRIIDKRFVDEVRSTGIDPCGENGEYHSFAFAGPTFRRPVEWHAGEVRNEVRFSQLDVLPGRAE